MKLNEKELRVINPGIYRFSHAMEGPPNLNDPHDELVKLLKRIRTTRIVQDYPDFYPDPSQFLSAWMRGYRDFPDTSKLYLDRSYLSPQVKGFELYYVNWHPSASHFKIAGRKGITPASRLKHTMLVSDINGMCDQRGYMNVGINDFTRRSVLVWRGEDEETHEPIPYEKLADMDKRLRDDLHFYVWSGKENFPFDSPNLLKAAGVRGTWTIIGYEPEEVYSELQKLRFIFLIKNNL